MLILTADDGALTANALVAIEVKGSPPVAPSGVQVMAISPTEIHITWTDNANNESGFMVEEGSITFTVAADVTSFTHSDLSPASNHCYRISAFNGYGSSAPTERTCTETLPAAVPIKSLNVRIRYEQRDNAADHRQDVPFQVTIKDESGNQILYQTASWVFPDPILDGNYGTATLLPSNPELVYGQTYQIFVRGAMHLTRQVTSTLTEGTPLDLTDPAVNPNGPLWGCDIDQDNEVDQADFDIWTAAVQAGAQPPPTPDPDSSDYRSDINGDHVINILDFSICAANLGKVGD
ncbi:MAG: fibronectin type III domain-containing protein [Caldilineaceae bacterium]